MRGECNSRSNPFNSDGRPGAVGTNVSGGLYFLVVSFHLLRGFLNRVL
jgi:hypothetical protein